MRFIIGTVKTAYEHCENPAAFLPGLYQRARLFNLLDQYRRHPAIWIQGQAGAGKTSLAASYVNRCKSDVLWYRVDAGDDDPATFFHYLTRTAEQYNFHRRQTASKPIM